MSKYEISSLQRALDKLNPQRTSASFVVEISKENNLVNHIVNEIRYNEVGDDDNQQAVADWIRGRSNLFINGVSFALLNYLHELATSKTAGSQAEVESSWDKIYEIRGVKRIILIWEKIISILF
jgi:hypothetical protein